MLKNLISKLICFVMCISFCTFPEVYAAGSDEEPIPPFTVQGDVDENGRVDAFDYIYLKRYLVKESGLNSSGLQRSDMNNDGIVNVFDLVMLKKKLFNTNIYLNCDTKEINTSDEDNTVYFYAEAFIENVNISLYDGLTGNFIMEMVDDGKYSESGDDLPGDNVYSCKFKIDNSEEKTLYYYAKIEETGEMSNLSKIDVYKSISAQDLADMSAVDNEISSLFSKEGFSSLSADERMAEFEALFDRLIGEGLIRKDSVSYDASRKMLNYKYKCGLTGSILLM